MPGTGARKIVLAAEPGQKNYEPHVIKSSQEKIDNGRYVALYVVPMAMSRAPCIVALASGAATLLALSAMGGMRRPATDSASV